MKRRWIRKVELGVGKDGFIWVHVHWDGEPEILSDGYEVQNRFYHTNHPIRRENFVRRVRLMQDMILAQIQ